MLTLSIPAKEMWDERINEFVSSEAVTLELEHSLIALSKWEQKYEKAFLGLDKKSTEEIVGYVQCMTVTPAVPEETFLRLTNDNFQAVQDYVEKKMTATFFMEEPKKSGKREIITAEIIYYWMTALNIPSEWETRHLNSLFVFLKVVNEKNAPQKKKSQGELLAHHRSINEERRAALLNRG